MAKFLYKSIPQYSKEILDILRDVREVDGEVIETKPLEEYLDNIDTVTFESIREYIKGILNLSDIEKTPKEYLPYLAYILGYTWDYDLDIEYQRFILKSIVQLYKRKGTKFNIHYNLSYFDPNVQITEPYKNIFILNRSILNGTHVFPSKDYSWGVYVVKSDYNPDVVKKIIDRTRPAGWSAIFDQVVGWSESFVPRPQDNLWEQIKKTSWYKDTYLEELHDYIMFGSLTNSSATLLYEDPTGYFIRGRGKQILLPRQYSLNNINMVSSGKRLFTNLNREIYLQGFGDKGIYLGPTFMYNSQYRVGQLGSESLITEDHEKQNALFLGKSISKLNDTITVLGKADNMDGGSLFKNAAVHTFEDWAQVGPLIPGVEASELGSRQWLEYDEKYVPYTNTSSVYMGLKPILWSSTSSYFYTDKEPYNSYGQYKFDQRDLDYYFYIHRAFSPKSYSRSILYGCRLVDGLLPDDDRLVLSNYDDIPFKGTLIFNNEFIEYEKIIDSSTWVKFFVDGTELKASNKTVDSFAYDLTYFYSGDNYRLTISRVSDKALKHTLYKNGIVQNPGTEYTILGLTANRLYIEDINTGIQTELYVETSDPKNWRLVIYNSQINFNYNLVSHVESTNFYINSDKYNIQIDKSAENDYQFYMKVNNLTDLTFNLNKNDKKITAYSEPEASVAPIDQICYVGNYTLEYDKDSDIVILYNTAREITLKVDFGQYAVKNAAKIYVEDTEVMELSATALTDRVDINFKIGNSSRTIYGASDKHGVFQAFYYEGSKRLYNGVDCDITILPRTIQIYDYTLRKHITVRYHNRPSIPIVRRFISKLGWGNQLEDNITFKRGARPRLLIRDDLIDYRYKLHKLNDMSVNISVQEYPTLTIILGKDVNDAEYLRYTDNYDAYLQTAINKLKEKDSQELHQLNTTREILSESTGREDDIAEIDAQIAIILDRQSEESTYYETVAKEQIDTQIKYLDRDYRHKKFYVGREGAEHNSVYVLRNGVWTFVAKYAQYEQIRVNDTKIDAMYASKTAFDAAIARREARKVNISSAVDRLVSAIKQDIETSKFDDEQLINLAYKVFYGLNTPDLTDEQCNIIGAYIKNVIDDSAFTTEEQVYNIVQSNFHNFEVDNSLYIPEIGDLVYVEDDSTSKYHNNIFTLSSDVQGITYDYVEKYEIAKVFTSKQDLLEPESSAGLLAGQYVAISNGLDEDELDRTVYLWNGDVFIFVSSDNKEKVLKDDPRTIIIYDENNVPIEKLEFFMEYSNYIADKNAKYAIKKEFVSVLEMQGYSGNDLQEGDHVIIKSPLAKSGERRIMQMHNQDDRVFAINTTFIGSYEFLGKQISADYIQKTDRHIGTHIIDKKYIKDGIRTNYSLNLGKKQSLSGEATEDMTMPLQSMGTLSSGANNSKSEVKQNPATLGGAGNQNNMAINRSDYIYQQHDWKSIGAPVTDINGKNFKVETDAKLYRYLIGERKPLGNTLYVEKQPKYNYRIDLGLARVINISTQKQSFSVSWDVYQALAPSVSIASITSTNYMLYSLPMRFVENPTDVDFVPSNAQQARSNFRNIVINRSTQKDWSLENATFNYIKFNWYGLEPVVSSVQLYKLGSRHLLGNTYFSKLPYRYFYIGIVNFHSFDIIHINKLEINVNSIIQTTPYVSGNEVDPIYKYGSYRLSKVLYNADELEKEKKLFTNSYTGKKIIAGASEDNINTMNYKTLIRTSYDQQKLETLILDKKYFNLGERYLLGNKASAYWSKIPASYLYIGNVDLELSSKVYADTLSITRTYLVDPRFFLRPYSDKTVSDYGMIRIGTFADGDDSTSVASLKTNISSKDAIIGGIGDNLQKHLELILPVKAKLFSAKIYPPIPDIIRFKLGQRILLGNSIRSTYAAITPTIIDLGKREIDYIEKLYVEPINITINSNISVAKTFDISSNIPLSYTGSFRAEFISDENLKKDAAFKSGNNTGTAILGGSEYKYNHKVITDLQCVNIYGVMTDKVVSVLGKKNLLGNNSEIFYSRAELKNLFIDPVTWKFDTAGTSVDINISANAAYNIFDVSIADNHKGHAQKYFSYHINNAAYTPNSGEKAFKTNYFADNAVLSGNAKHSVLDTTAAVKVTRKSIWAPTTSVIDFKLGSNYILGNWAKKRLKDYYCEYIDLGLNNFEISLKVYESALLLSISSYAASPIVFRDYDNSPVSSYGIFKVKKSGITQTTTLDDHALTLGDNHACILGGTEGKYFNELELVSQAKSSVKVSSLIPIYLNYKQFTLGKRALLGNNYKKY